MAQDKCVQPAKGPIVAQAEQSGLPAHGNGRKEATRMIARVGKTAPDFELSAFVDGGFKNIRLSEYAGKWIVLCFYPGDFTFV